MKLFTFLLVTLLAATVMAQNREEMKSIIRAELAKLNAEEFDNGVWSITLSTESSDGTFRITSRQSGLQGSHGFGAAIFGCYAAVEFNIDAMMDAYESGNMELVAKMYTLELKAFYNVIFGVVEWQDKDGDGVFTLKPESTPAENVDRITKVHTMSALSPMFDDFPLDKESVLIESVPDTTSGTFDAKKIQLTCPTPDCKFHVDCYIVPVQHKEKIGVIGNEQFDIDSTKCIIKMNDLPATTDSIGLLSWMVTLEIDMSDAKQFDNSDQSLVMLKFGEMSYKWDPTVTVDTTFTRDVKVTRLMMDDFTTKVQCDAVECSYISRDVSVIEQADRYWKSVAANTMKREDPTPLSFVTINTFGVAPFTSFEWDPVLHLGAKTTSYSTSTDEPSSANTFGVMAVLILACLALL